MNDEDIWLSAAEIAELDLEYLPSSKVAVLNWAKKNEWEFRPRKGRGAGFIFSFLSFPKEAQQEIKNNPEKWQLVCELSKKRGKKLLKQNKQFLKQTETKPKQAETEDTSIPPEDRELITASARRLVVEEFFHKKINREDLAINLGLSLRELEQYEHAEKPLNIVHLQKLQKLGFDIMFILTGEKISTGKSIKNEVNNNSKSVITIKNE